MSYTCHDCGRESEKAHSIAVEAMTAHLDKYDEPEEKEDRRQGEP